MMLLSDGGNALQPFLLAAFPERCARGCGRARPRTPRAASECIASTRALFAVIPGKCLKSESAWRSEVNSNCPAASRCEFIDFVNFFASGLDYLGRVA